MYGSLLNRDIESIFSLLVSGSGWLVPGLRGSASLMTAEDIERYSKRYMKVYKEEWIPDWRRLPREMMPRKKCKKGPKSQKPKATGKGASLTNTADVLKKIEELEKRGDGEKSDEENEEKEGSKEKSKEGDDDEDDDAVEQEEYDEEEQEEENDYINSYFEDGDDFGADSDDNMDEATY
ncbi:DNA-directed RNA polymerase III subunit RPC7 [Hyaena hyaena]|uniref:DNA-directed RNA polymerase III subunit RPC7 n=1 Tax=Hyaena hyaena TaxID=95912 RepID=UPI001923EC41|nr:DNA-directed RNA polymerase III subunit RPC7 [Hyaena hyaena]